MLKERTGNQMKCGTGRKQVEMRMGFWWESPESEFHLHQSLVGFLVSLGYGFIYKTGLNMPTTQSYGTAAMWSCTILIPVLVFFFKYVFI